MEYTLTLNSAEDYRLLKKLLQKFEGATIRPIRQKPYTLKQALKEVENGDIVGPFTSADDFMKDLLS